MSGSNDNIENQFDEVNKRLGELNIKEVSEISEKALYEFCRGFELFIIGSLEFLKQQTQSHRVVEITVDGEQIEAITSLTNKNYKDFTIDLTSIIPPTEIDFRYKLKNSIYPIVDITDSFTVFFFQDKYEIRYSYGADKEKIYAKDYMTYIEPDEILELRNLISSNIIKKVSVKLDQLVEN